MVDDKNNLNKEGSSRQSETNWKPVMVFYAKTTSWIILPLVIGLIAGNFTKSQTLFFVFLMIGFGITCLGIYREIKQYKKDFLPEADQPKAEEKQNGNK
ncbi:MAG: hypothetical protein WC735_01145 [Candidatus Paceibacterota bacterium]|jgi:F0F1-type ATP synthase assembly protein I